MKHHDTSGFNILIMTCHSAKGTKIIPIYYDNLARAAAILHDIGHLPFSHSVERTLGFNHHELTEKYVKDWEIESILNKINLTSL